MIQSVDSKIQSGDSFGLAFPFPMLAASSAASPKGQFSMSVKAWFRQPRILSGTRHLAVHKAVQVEGTSPLNSRPAV
jgi:hypothetical protein